MINDGPCGSDTGDGTAACTDPECRRGCAMQDDREPAFRTPCLVVKGVRLTYCNK